MHSVDKIESLTSESGFVEFVCLLVVVRITKGGNTIKGFRNQLVCICERRNVQYSDLSMQLTSG